MGRRASGRRASGRRASGRRASGRRASGRRASGRRASGRRERREKERGGETPNPNHTVHVPPSPTSISASSFSALPAAFRPFQPEPVHRLSPQLISLCLPRSFKFTCHFTRQPTKHFKLKKALSSVTFIQRSSMQPWQK